VLRAGTARAPVGVSRRALSAITIAAKLDSVFMFGALSFA